jgi:ATP synthase mitochondrial F1 complex assembly factor 2
LYPFVFILQVGLTSCLDDQDGYEILLDSRPVRTPAKAVLTVPPTKPHLADAIALEWDLLTSAQQALKQHSIPLTSLASRANDVSRQDAQGQAEIRNEVMKTVMHYLDTDTLLCWAPEGPPENERKGPYATLRAVQMEIAQRIIDFLTQALWPGIDIKPALEADSIMPTSQPEHTKTVIRNWISSLPPYELAALEKGVLAGKSFLVAARLVVEWSEHFRHLQQHGERRFGIEEAAEASSLEVRWQTGIWGEVEDTHDVDKEDLKRQLGSVVLLVSGETE